MHRATDFDSRQTRTSFGFTLVELLVVIGIIGMLVALLLPAVMSAQEQARQTQCAKQMKDLAGANLAHAMKKGRFPGWNEGGDTWVEAILPYLDMQQAAITQSYNTNPEADPLFYCPSNPPEDTTALYLSYVANAGRQDSGGAEPEEKQTAVFHDRSDPTAALAMGLEDIRDGKRNTLLLAEIATHGNWNTPGEQTTGFNFDPTDVSGNNTSALKTKGVVDLNNVRNTNGAPASFHQEGFNVAYCDGHTDFYFYPDQSQLDEADRTTLEYQIFRAKMTPQGASQVLHYDTIIVDP